MVKLGWLALCVSCQACNARSRDSLAALAKFLLSARSVLSSGCMQVAQAVKSRPNMLGLQLESVKKMVGFLAASGKSVDEIAELLQTSL